MSISDFSGINDILRTTESIIGVPGVVYGRSGTGTSDGFALALDVVAGIRPTLTPTHLDAVIQIVQSRWLCVLNISAMSARVALALLAMLNQTEDSTVHRLAVYIMETWSTESIPNAAETPDETIALDVWRKAAKTGYFANAIGQLGFPAIIRIYYYEVNRTAYYAVCHTGPRGLIQPHKRLSLTCTTQHRLHYTKKAYPAQSTHGDIIYSAMYERCITFTAVCHLQMAVLLIKGFERDAIVAANCILMDLWKSHQTVSYGLWKHAPVYMWVAATAICCALGNRTLTHDHNFGSTGSFSTNNSSTHPFSTQRIAVGDTFVKIGIADANSADGIRTRAARYMQAIDGLLGPNICIILKICLDRKHLHVPNEILQLVASFAAPNQPLLPDIPMWSLLGPPHPVEAAEPETADSDPNRIEYEKGNVGRGSSGLVANY